MVICGGSQSNARRVRRALTLVEITIAAALLGLLMATSVQVLRALQTQQRAADRRAVALLTVQALAEQVSNFRWDDVSTERLIELQIPDTMAVYLPAAKLITSMTEERDPIAAKRVSFELTWRGLKGQPIGPVRLTIWVYNEEAS